MVNENGVPSSAWSPYNIINPLNGTPITLYNLSSSLTSLPPANLHQTNAPQSLVRNVYTGYEVQAVARMGHGIFTSFGYTIDRQLDRACAESVTTAKPLADPNTLRYCDMFGDSGLSFAGINISSLGKVSPPWAQAFTLQGSIPIRWGFVGSASFLSNNYQGNFGGGAFGAAGVTTTGTLNNGYLARTWALTAATKYPAGCVGCQVLAAGAACPTGANAAPTVGCAADPGSAVCRASRRSTWLLRGKSGRRGSTSSISA